jgi:hypothetical protein
MGAESRPLPASLPASAAQIGGYGEIRRWLSTVATPGAEAAAARAALASFRECTCPQSFAVWSDTSTLTCRASTSASRLKASSMASPTRDR